VDFYDGQVMEQDLNYALGRVVESSVRLSKWGIEKE
jgi:hypothetical protein